MPNDESRDADPIDEEAAMIDARSPDAEEQIEDLVEHAQELGRDAEVPGSETLAPPATAPDPDAPGLSVLGDQAGEPVEPNEPA